MSIVTMNMSSYEIEHNDLVDHADEGMCTDWYPGLALQTYTEPQRRSTMPLELVSIDADAFLNRMYTYQS